MNLESAFHSIDDLRLCSPSAVLFEPESVLWPSRETVQQLLAVNAIHNCYPTATLEECRAAYREYEKREVQRLLAQIHSCRSDWERRCSILDLAGFRSASSHFVPALRKYTGWFRNRKMQVPVSVVLAFCGEARERESRALIREADSEIREYAEIGSDPTYLLSILARSDARHRHATRQLIRQWCQQLPDSDYLQNLIDALRPFGKEAVNDLCGQLRGNRFAAARIAAAHSLGWMGAMAEDALPVLEEARNDNGFVKGAFSKDVGMSLPDESVRSAAETAISDIRSRFVGMQTEHRFQGNEGVLVLEQLCVPSSCWSVGTYTTALPGQYDIEISAVAASSFLPVESADCERRPPPFELSIDGKPEALEERETTFAIYPGHYSSCWRLEYEARIALCENKKISVRAIGDNWQDAILWKVGLHVRRNPWR